MNGLTKYNFSCNGILVGHKKECTKAFNNTDEPWKYNASKRSQTEKAIYYKIPFIQNVQNRQTDTKSSFVVAMGWRKGRMRSDTNVVYGFFRDDKNVLEL